MKNYKVVFFKKEEKNEKNKEGLVSKETTYKFLGHVFVDDYGIDDEHTLISKAYRHAPNFSHADKVLVERV